MIYWDLTYYFNVHYCVNYLQVFCLDLYFLIYYFQISSLLWLFLHFLIYFFQFSEYLKHIKSEQKFVNRAIGTLVECFAHSKKWKVRQTFALLCAEIMRNTALSGEIFNQELMPHLLDLGWDPVPNIRLVVARTLAREINNKGINIIILSLIIKFIFILKNFYSLSTNFCKGISFCMFILFNN